MTRCPTPVMSRGLALALLLALAPVATATALEVRPDVSTDGVYHLTWAGDGVEERVLEESRDASFEGLRVVYRGTDTAAVLTGRSDGTYHYRVRRPDGGTSDTVQVTVEHHSLGRALGFFTAGAVVFLATVGVVVGGRIEEALGDD